MRNPTRSHRQGLKGLGNGRSARRSPHAPGGGPTAAEIAHQLLDLLGRRTEKPMTKHSRSTSLPIPGTSALMVDPRVCGGLVAFALAMLLGGCAADASGVPAAAAAPHAPPTWTVIGIDRSGSYAFLEPGREMALTAVREATPGDTIIVRWISDNSYRNTDFVLRFAASGAALRDCSGNPYDTKCRRENLAAQLATKVDRDKAIAQVRELQVAAAPKTDIVGFLLVAAEVLAAAPPDAVRQVWLATDLLDNVRQYNLPVDLAGAKVFVRGLENDDPAKAVALRAEWQERFVRYGASDVLFESAEVVP